MVSGEFAERPACREEYPDVDRVPNGLIGGVVSFSLAIVFGRMLMPLDIGHARCSQKCVS